MWRGRQLHQASAVDHPDSVGDGGGIVERVGDEEGRELERCQHVGELVADLFAGDRVERSERFVEQ